MTTHIYQEVKKSIGTATQVAFNIGDKSECYIKHIGHTLSAIYVGNGYKNVVDYRSPNGDEGFIDSKEMKELHNLWEKVEKLSSKISKEKFKEIAQKNRHAEYFDDDCIQQAKEGLKSEDEIKELIAKNQTY